MPDEDAGDEEIERWSTALLQVQAPLTDNEARVLVQCFPPDMGFGVGWALLHLVETAPGWSQAMAETINDPEWKSEALGRLADARK